MIDDVNEQLFPDPTTRLNYIIGVISHSVILNSVFNMTHTGAAATSLGPVPRGTSPAQPSGGDTARDAEAGAGYMIDTLSHPVTPQHPIPTQISYKSSSKNLP